MALTMVPCPKASSNVREIGYDAESRTLAVRFGGGALYHYEAVPDDVYADLLKADSIGAFIAKNVRGQFKATAIDESSR